MVVGGEAGNKLVWDSVVRMLRMASDIEVHPLEADIDPEGPIDEVNALVDEYHAQVLVVVSDTGVSPEAFRRYWRHNPNLVVIGIESDGPDTIVRLKKLGKDVLAELIRSVALAAVEDDATSEHPSGSVHVLDTDDLRRLEGGASATLAIPADIADLGVHRHYRDALKWVDNCLHRALLGIDEQRGIQESTPGWTVSPSQARKLLGGEFAESDRHALEQAQIRLEHNLSKQIEDASKRSGLFRIYDAFALDELHRKILWLCLAPEIDGRYATVFGVINDDLTRRRPTATTLSQLLYSGRNDAFDVLRLLEVDGPNALFRIVEVEHEPRTPRSETPLKPAAEILSFISTAGDSMPAYNGRIRVAGNAATPEYLGESTAGLRKRIAGWLKIGRSTDVRAPIFHLEGREATIRWFERAAAELQCSVVVFDISQLAEQSGAEQRAACLGACRAAQLHSAALIVTGRDLDSDEHRRALDGLVLRMASSRIELLVVHGRPLGTLRVGRSVLSLRRGRPGIADRAAIWRDRARLRGVTMPNDLSEDMATTVRFEEDQIDATLRLSPGKYTTIEQIKKDARRVAVSSVPVGARNIEPKFTFDDIVLSADTRKELELIPLHVRHSRCVMEDWEFERRMPYGQAVTALFTGPSGCGKSMASQAIARAIGVTCMRVDLSQCRSKWYGESESRINEVFEAAEKSCAVLQIEEAEAMFRSRSSGSNHDRQGESEVAFLLDRMESYSGVAILTTNLKENIDTAFLRRLRFVIPFAPPGYEERLAIWHKVFPSADLLTEDVSFDFLARRLELAPGHCQQIACRAAYLAAPTNSRISMGHIYAATRQELRKLGMQNAERKIAEKEKERDEKELAA